MSNDQFITAEPDGPAHEALSGRRRLPRQLALGFAYWFLFLILLQPGNMYEAGQANVSLPFTQELLRISGASLLGAVVTPLLLALTHRFPVEGSRRWQHAWAHAIALLALSLILIVVAQLLADWILTHRDARLRAPMDRQLVADGPLLFFCMITFIAGAHAFMFWGRAEQESLLLAQVRSPAAPPAASPPAPAYLATVLVKTRGRVLLLSVVDIDWVETQGNYLALHAGPAVHLIRDTLTNLESRLDPERFARIHRTTLVALDRVQEVAALSNGDASVRLRDGTLLRLSRKYRAAAAALLASTGGR